MHSTETATASFTDFIIKELDQNKKVAAVFFDLSLAFDTVDKNIMENKLHALGIRGNVLKLVVSFLSGRHMYVDTNGQTSSKYDVRMGVAQGSILGPLLFLCFINDLSDYITDGHLVNYADDTSIALSAANSADLQDKVNRCVREFQLWCEKNKLILNVNKTVFMQFCLRNDSEIVLLNSSQYTKFLGLYIDYNLSWNQHIDYVVNKLNAAYYAVLKLKAHASVPVLLELYYALAYSHLRYNIIVWGQSVSCQRAFVAQKRIVRLIFNLDYLATCRNTFIENRIMTFVCIYIYILLCHLYFF